MGESIDATSLNEQARELAESWRKLSPEPSELDAAVKAYGRPTWRDRIRGFIDRLRQPQL